MKKQLTKFALTATFVLAFIFAISCGEHGWEEIYGTEDEESNSNNNIVGPLLQTKWSQGSPYNDLFPIVDGKRMVTDCGTTAWVQIMAFHKYPPRGKGESSNVGPGDHPVQLTSLDVAYDWNNMLNEYTSKNPGNEQQRSAVATLMYHYGLARSVNGINSLVNNFGYDKSYQRLFREYYSDAEWEAIIREQLDLGLPVYYHGSSVANDDEENFSVESGHTFVVDGYDNNTGKFHFNWGWSGSYDGWHSLNDIDAGKGRRYNYGNVMGINIKPDAGSIGSNEMGLNSFTVSKGTVSQIEGVTVTAKIRSAGFFSGGQAGVALVNNSGNIVAIIGTINYNAINPNATRTSTINCSALYSINPGQYNLRIVTKMNGEDWKIITHSLPDVPKSIPFIVTASGTKGGGWGLSLRRFEIYPDAGKTTVSINEEFTVDHSLSDVNSTTFPGATSGVALMDENDNIVEILGTLEIPPVTNSNRAVGKKIKCKVLSAAPGQYKLRIVVKTSGKDEWRVVTSTEGTLPTFIDFIVQQT